VYLYYLEGVDISMNDQIQDNRVRILEMQVMECKKEINLILEANERYFYLIESLIKF